MTLGEIIKEYRTQHDMSMAEFSQRSGISKAYISLLEKNKHPKTGKPIAPSIQSIKQAATGMNMDFDKLFSMIGGRVDLKPSDAIPSESFTRIPLYSKIAGGKPIEMNDSIIGYVSAVDIPENGEYFALQVKGRSMEPNILDGDVVVVHSQPDAENGEVVVITIDGESATCKRLYKYADHLSLLSFNPDYPPMEYSDKEIANLPVRIYGKVVQLIRKFK